MKSEIEFINEIQERCLRKIEAEEHKSFDLYDALTNTFLNKISKNKPLLRRIFIQINVRCPFDLHWLGMKKMVHTKTISDLLWYYSISDNSNKNEIIKFYFQWLLKLKNSKGYGWGLNFPYTSRFIDADENMPNLYNTMNSGIALCSAYQYLGDGDKIVANNVLRGILDFLDKELGFVDEKDKGWYLYYPGQKYPTYNVNALALYFLSFAKKLDIYLGASLEQKALKIVNLLVSEQEQDGSWFYSRSPKGKWIDGFHSAFVIESIAFAYANGYYSLALESCLHKGYSFYIEQMFTKKGYPKYFSNSGDFPIEAQNAAQAIQTLSTCQLWLGKAQLELLRTNIHNCIRDLFDSKGFFYQKRIKFFFNKTPYFRWSVTPMILALEYAKKAINTE